MLRIQSPETRDCRSNLDAYLGLLFGPEPSSSYIELRWRRAGAGGMAQAFHPVGDHDAVAKTIAATSHTDCYIGVAPRTKRSGGKDAVERCHVLWADIDNYGAQAKLRRDLPRPTAWLDSGGGEGHAHVYWAICPAVGPEQAKKANRRLAHPSAPTWRALTPLVC